MNSQLDSISTWYVPLLPEESDSLFHWGWGQLAKDIVVIHAEADTTHASLTVFKKSCQKSSK